MLAAFQFMLQLGCYRSCCHFPGFTSPHDLDPLHLSHACICTLLQEDLSRSQLNALQQLQESVASHKVTRHEPLEALARGLLKHVTDDRTDQEQLPSMLKYVVKQAALQTHTAHAAAGEAAASSSSAAGSSSRSSNGAGSSRAAAEAASSSSRMRVGHDQLPAGESSLTATELLMVLEQLAAAKASEEQLALYQVGLAGQAGGERLVGGVMVSRLAV
jgi:hypothetical protein